MAKKPFHRDHVTSAEILKMQQAKRLGIRKQFILRQAHLGRIRSKTQRLGKNRKIVWISQADISRIFQIHQNIHSTPKGMHRMVEFVREAREKGLDITASDVSRLAKTTQPPEGIARLVHEPWHHYVITTEGKRKLLGELRKKQLLKQAAKKRKIFTLRDLAKSLGVSVGRVVSRKDIKKIKVIGLPHYVTAREFKRVVEQKELEKQISENSITTAQMAEMFGVTEGAVLHWIRKGLPSVRIWKWHFIPKAIVKIIGPMMKKEKNKMKIIREFFSPSVIDSYLKIREKRLRAQRKLRAAENREETLALVSALVEIEKELDHLIPPSQRDILTDSIRALERRIGREQ